MARGGTEHHPVTGYVDDFDLLQASPNNKNNGFANSQLAEN